MWRAIYSNIRTRGPRDPVYSSAFPLSVLPQSLKSETVLGIPSELAYATRIRIDR